MLLLPRLINDFSHAIVLKLFAICEHRLTHIARCFYGSVDNHAYLSVEHINCGDKYSCLSYEKRLHKSIFSP
jgi:hypothetical protein